MKHIKNWTILIYANGNNDLEPEMYQSKLDIKKIGSNEDINIIIEIGRTENQIINLIRPSLIHFYKNKWSGVKMYYIKSNKSILIKDLGNINMSKSENLYNFIKWGIENFPAKHYIVIFGGHGYEFVGTMTDYNHDAPYIMGIPEMINDLNKINKNIDLLIADTCFFNTIEIIYELGKHKNHTVQNMLTYIREGPIEGLPYSKIIELIKQNPNIDINNLIKKLIDYLKLDLVAFRIDNQILKKIKKAINDLSLSYLSNTNNENLSPSQLLYSFDKRKPWTKYLDEYYKNLAYIVIYYKRFTNKNNPLINIARMNLENINKLSKYFKFEFAKNNYWTHILSKKSINDKIYLYTKENSIPIRLTLNEVYLYTHMVNQHLSNKEVLKIVKDLYKYKNWKLV
ncbi:hypothetical protein SAMN02745883_00343 [Caminicella sporogenes DSM 14501]|uniref:Clostripain family protein n=1 Tax=Caminicella sporogenes DSM 14501 TaxID=1121266 RepID=A0A1M6LTP1_9FIRM|nr:clostripain-related cysteine peptidase [Caminicella sporogenes]RKD27949.1 hypothetical protein BET04_02500 [Caminicella sporogenes]WIF94448.1 clostripain-related cysteine peptidase [Caminicella sporogenes]SHJ74589.1 hypothetical protein SAMN02745883_00343 [Caminicella sporogenes DSM 14501]